MALQSDSNIPQIILQVNGLQRTIAYRGIIKNVDDEYWKDTFLPKIYPFWDSDRDRLIRYTYYSDDSSFVERKKWVKDFKTGEFTWKDYEFYGYPKEEGTKLFEICQETYFNIAQLEKENLNEELVNIYGAAQKYTWFTVKTVRKFLLDDSDWVFCEDSPISSETKELWKTYRKKLRDIPVEQQDVIAKDVKIPIDPDFFSKFYSPDHPDEEYLSSDAQFYRLTNTIETGFRDRVMNYLISKYNIDKSYTDIRSLIQKYQNSDLFAQQTVEASTKYMFEKATELNKTIDELGVDLLIESAEKSIASNENIERIEDGYL